MTTFSLRGRRPVAGALAACATVAVLALGAGTAAAVGTGGVELTPDPARGRDGKAITAFHVTVRSGGESTQRFQLRNITDRPVSVRLYAAAARRGADGSYAVAGPGTASWIELEERTLSLPPRAEQRGTFVVHAGGAPAGDPAYGAIVLERSAGTVVTRAATMVYLERGGGGPGRERNVLLIAVAGALVAAVGSGQLLARRRYR